MRVLGSERVLPLLLAAASRGRTDFAALVPELERIEFRALLSNIEQNRMANMYFDLAAMLRAGWVDVADVLAELQAWTAKWADDGRFVEGMRDRLVYGTQKSNNQIKHLLTTIDDYYRWLDGGTAGRPRPRKTSVWDFGQIEDEHIFPQHPVGGLPAELLDHVHRLGNQAFWGPGDNKRKEASNNLPTTRDKIDAYLSADAELTKRVGRQLDAKAQWGALEIDARGTILMNQALRIYDVPAEARTRAAELGRSRPAVFRHRESGTRRVWLVLDLPGSPFEAIGASEHRISTTTYSSRDIVPGDTVISVQPRQRPPGGGPARPQRVGRVGRVARVRFQGATERRLILDPDSIMAIPPPWIPLRLISPGVGTISITRPVVDGAMVLGGLVDLIKQAAASPTEAPETDAQTQEVPDVVA